MTRQPRAGKAAVFPPASGPRPGRQTVPRAETGAPARSGTVEDPDAAGRDVRQSGADRLFIGSVAKSFQILELLSTSGRGLTLMELAERSGLGKSAAQRATHTLRALGYLSQHPESRAYSLSYRMLELTHTVLAEDRVRMASLPHLEALSQACGETVNLTRLAGTDVVFIARFPSRHSVSVDLHIGSRLPAYCTAPGRAILSRLPDDEAKRLIAASDRKALTPNTVTDPRRLWSLLLEARKRGFALNNQESQIGDVSIGAPLLDRGGRVVGAINIAAPSPRLSITRLQQRHGPDLMQTAADISRGLGFV